MVIRSLCVRRVRTFLAYAAPCAGVPLSTTSDSRGRLLRAALQERAREKERPWRAAALASDGRPLGERHARDAFVHHSFRFLLGCVVACLAAGCGGNSVTTTEAPTPVKCATNLSGLPASVPATGTKVQATVSAARECSWSATTDATWLALSPDAGQGGAQVTVAIAANNAPTARSGAIVLNGARVTLNQEPAPCRFDLNRSSAQIARRGWARAGVDHHDGRLHVEGVQPGTLGEFFRRHGNRQPYRRADRRDECRCCALRDRRDRGPQVQGRSVERRHTRCAATSRAGPDAWARAIARPAADSGALLHLRGQRRPAAVQPGCGHRQVRSGHAGWLQLDRIDHRQLDPDHPVERNRFG